MLLLLSKSCLVLICYGPVPQREILLQQELLSIVHNGSILLLFNEGDIMQVNFTKYRLFNLTTRLFLNARLNERQKNAKIAK